MIQRENPDYVAGLLSSIKPLEPRPGLKEEIYARIVQEPVPAEVPKRFLRMNGRSVAAIAASFAGAVLLAGGVYYTQHGFFGKVGFRQEIAGMPTDVRGMEPGSDSGMQTKVPSGGPSVAPGQDSSKAAAEGNRQANRSETEGTKNVAVSQTPDSGGNRENAIMSVKPQNREDTDTNNSGSGQNLSPASGPAQNGGDTGTFAVAEKRDDASEMGTAVKEPDAAQAGLLALEKGLKVTLRDASSVRRQFAGKEAVDAITPKDVSLIIKELFAANAAWVRVNGMTINSQDSVTASGNRLVVSGISMSPPYVVEVGGDPAQIRQAIQEKGSVIDSLWKSSKIEVSFEPIR